MNSLADAALRSNSRAITSSPEFNQARSDPHDSTPAELIDALQAAFGKHHARAVHAKGILLDGVFEPSAQAGEFCSAKIFSSGSTSLLLRFSNFTGVPNIADASPLANPRGLAIRFNAPANESMDVVSHSFNGFPTKTADEFRQLLQALAASNAATKAPTPLDEFLACHPIAKLFLTTQKPSPVSYATLAYFGVNTFRFTSSQGVAIAVRYRFLPHYGELFLSPSQTRYVSDIYLQEELIKRLAKGPATFDWFAQVAERGDVLDDPSIAWPETRPLIKLGQIRIEHPTACADTKDHRTVFLPGTLPPGISSADPMIGFRDATYPLSFANRSDVTETAAK